MRKIKFITGPAGTGKSTRLRQLLEADETNHLICAPTGIAAINVGGSTIHRTFKINPESGSIGQRWPFVETVYVDEVSMMGMKLFDLIISAAPNANFVFIGDMAQLPPVKDRYWFQSEYINQFDVEIEHLTTNYRQGDSKLADTLNKIRDGSVMSKDLRQLYSDSCHPIDNQEAITLAYRNDTVNSINLKKLLSVKEELYEFEAEYFGLMKPQDCKAEKNLQVKVGVDVIMLNNDKEDRWQNGTRGKIVGIIEHLDSFDEPECFIEVKFGEKIYTVKEHEWTLKTPKTLTQERRLEIEQQLMYASVPLPELEHALKTGIEYVIIGSCKQFPMKLAYALTVHKSQGMTLDAAHIMMSGFAGCYGIGYVALSRTRNIDNLSFDKKPTASDFKFDERIKNYL